MFVSVPFLGLVFVFLYALGCFIGITINDKIINDIIMSIKTAVWVSVCLNYTFCFLDVMFLLCFTVSLCFGVCNCVLIRNFTFTCNFLIFGCLLA